MTIPLPSELNEKSLMLWWMHRLAEEFSHQAILKGGMALALLNSPRKTNDLDYVFVPFRSKKDIEKKLRQVAKEIPEAKVTLSHHSKTLRIAISVDDLSIQIEANVALECESLVTTTASLAQSLNILPKPIRIMSLDVALAHKLAAWNERRLFRDLFDVYFLFEVQGEKPDLKTLVNRLSKIESRIPKNKGIKKLTVLSFSDLLEKELQKITQSDLEEELGGIIAPVELIGLQQRMKATLARLVHHLRLVK